MAKPITEAQLYALKRAARRERGNLCPSALRGHSETLVLQALTNRGLIDWDSGVPFKGAPRINDAGREVVAHAEVC
jgi:hypothetical protein